MSKYFNEIARTLKVQVSNYTCCCLTVYHLLNIVLDQKMVFWKVIVDRVLALTGCWFFTNILLIKVDMVLDKSIANSFDLYN